MFPIIKHIDDLRSQVGHMPEIRFETNEDGFTVVCYMIAGADTFSGENKHYARECRGITFYPDGTIASRPFHKFFNVGEREETLPHNIKWDQMSRVMDKRDGSMVHPVRVNGKIIFKTKKTFYSDVAILATKLLHTEKYAETLKFCHVCIDLGVTPLFEFTTPEWRIVLNYDQQDLRLLHIRDNITGTYSKDPKKYAEAWGYNIDCVDEYDVASFGPEELQRSMDEDEGKEGYVIAFNDGSMVKGKTKWYINLHHAVVFVRERDIARMVIEETVDDYKSFVSLQGASLDTVNEIERRVLEELDAIKLSFLKAVEFAKSFSHVKDAAAALKDNKLQKFILQAYRGIAVDIEKVSIEYFEDHVLKQKFSLVQV